jgi:hypothetical protein
MATIENRTLTTHIFIDSNNNKLRLLPGINLLVPDEFTDLVKSTPGFKQLIAQEWIVFIDFEPEVQEIFKDDETGITYVDDNGEKMPITKASVNGSSSLVATGSTFELDSLKEKGFSNQLATKIINQSPESGWDNAEQIIESFNLSGKSADLVKTLF